MVHDQLRQLLLEHDCVTLPGFGALLAEPVPARIHPVRHTLSPPARRVIFSDRLRHDDGLLTAAVERTLPAAQAAAAPARVRSFTEELRAALREHRAAELRGLGTLRQTTDTDPIRFEALEPGYLPLAASFGLPELVSRPVVLTERPRATRYVPETPTSAPHLRPIPTRLRRLVTERTEGLYRAGTAAIVVLLLTATYLNFRLSPLESRYLPGNFLAAREAAVPQRAAVGATEPDLLLVTPALLETASEPTAESAPEAVTELTSDAVPASVEVVEQAAPLARKRTPAPDALRTPAPKAAAPPAPVSVPEPAPTIRTAPTNRYYLVWNAFTTQAKAEKGRMQVTQLASADAATAVVLTPPRGSALYRVAVADYATHADATAALPALRARYGPALWVLRY